MASLNCIEIIDRDKNGNVVKAGAAWNEKTGYSYGLRVFIFVCGAVLAIFAAWILLYAAIHATNGPNADGRFVANFLAFITGVPGIFLMAAVVRKQPKRSLVFHRDGTIETPYGIPGEKSLLAWPKRWSLDNLKAIEAVGYDSVWRVDLISTKGDTVTVSAGLDREEARKVATMLKEAWNAFAPHQVLEIL